ncbi:MAG: Trp family transcriptional regulator [Candidatus Magasanikbacteria bacterium]
MGFVQNKKELLQILSGIKDISLMENFLNDLLTPAEIKDIVMRLQIVKLLHQGVTQREVAKKLGVSISKVERGARELLDKKGGFAKIFRLRPTRRDYAG